MNFLNQHVHIIPTPVCPTRKSATVCCKADIIRKLFSRIRIRIKIVVHVNGIHIIAGHNVAYNLADVFSGLRQPRIKIQLAGILHKQFRILAVGMHGRQSTCAFRLGTIRINPRMKFHVPLVAFLNHKLQRVPHRRRSFSLHTGQETAPWFVRRFIQGIRLCPHLKNDGIDTSLLQVVQLAHQHLLHFLRRHTLELSVYTLYPGSAKLPFGITCLSIQVARPQASQKDKQHQ